MEWEVLTTPALYNSGKLCKPFRYMECKRNIWKSQEGGGGGRFQRRKVRVADFDRITGAFAVLGENDNGRRVVEFCAEKGLCGGNTYFKHGSLHKYTRVARGQDGVEVKIMIDLVLVKRDMLRYV